MSNWSPIARAAAGRAPLHPSALYAARVCGEMFTCAHPGTYTGHIRPGHTHGPVAQRLHTARRADDLDCRRRVIDAKRQQPSADPGRQDNSQWWDTPPQPWSTVEASTKEPAPLDVDYYRLELVFVALTERQLC